MSTISAIAMLGAFGGPAPASAAVIGTPDISGWQGTYACPSNPCTFSNLRVSDGTARSPIRGTIKRWRINAYRTGTVHLQVLRRTVDEPGFAADEFEAVRQTDKRTTVRGRNVFDASLRVRKGDFIGLAVVTGSDLVRARIGPSARHGVKEPAFIPGDPASPFSSISPDQSDLLFNATVKG